MRTLTSFNFLQSVLALIGLALVVGLVVWLFERRHNEEFGGGVAKGLSSSVWWTTVAMTQRGIGQQGPRTMPGRFVAMLWMVGSIIAIAVFTAGITSALTVRHLQGNVQGVTDLSQVRVGAVAGSSTEETLTKSADCASMPFPTARDGLQAIRDGKTRRLRLRPAAAGLDHQPGFPLVASSCSTWFSTSSIMPLRCRRAARCESRSASRC